VSASDAILKRIERRALVLTAVGAAIALFVPHGGWLAAAGVIGGAAVAGVSYWAIRRGVAGLGSVLLAQDARPRTARGLIAFVARYALLAALAYVMIARLHLHPIALLAGASVIPLATVAEVWRRRD
jgi:hypothetical protein